MIARYFFTPLFALPLLAAPLLAQNIEDAAYRADDRPAVTATETTGPTIPYANSASMAPMQLRGGAVATGLHGFYDYQSNGGSPEYIEIRPGAWSTIYTTFMNSLGGADAADISNSRRAGYAYSNNNGATWVSNREVSPEKLGYPDIEVSAEPVPYIAAHGDFGGGNQIVVFGNPTPASADAFIPIGEFPVTAANGLPDRGVIWPSFELNVAETHGLVAASYFSDASNPSLPLHFGSVDLISGQGPQQWSALQDSLHSTASGGRYVLARSAGGSSASHGITALPRPTTPIPRRAFTSAKAPTAA